MFCTIRSAHSINSPLHRHPHKYPYLPLPFTPINMITYLQISFPENILRVFNIYIRMPSVDKGTDLLNPIPVYFRLASWPFSDWWGESLLGCWRADRQADWLLNTYTKASSLHPNTSRWRFIFSLHGQTLCQKDADVH